MNSTIQLPGAHYEAGRVETTRYNRTGATTVVGGVGFVDSSQSDAASTTIALGLDNVVKPTTTLIGKTPRLVIWQEAGVADDARGRCVEGEGVRVRVLVEGTANIAAGTKLKPVNNQVYMVAATAANPFTVAESGSATDNADVWYVEALEAFTTDSTTTVIEGILYSSGKR